MMNYDTDWSGGFSVRIDGDGDEAYERRVYDLLDKVIAPNVVGRALFAALKGTGKKIKIVPYTEEDAKRSGQCNAMETPDDDRDAHPADEGYYRGRNDNPDTPEDERYDRATRGRWIFKREVEGTGKGSDATVHFTDTLWGTGSACAPGGSHASMPADILFHEIAHGLRDMLGVANQVPTEKAQRGYDNFEEFFAVVLTNEFISASGRDDLRADHWGFKALDPALSTSEGFLADPENAFLVAVQTMHAGSLPRDLSLITSAAFNPTGEYMRHAAKYLAKINLPASMKRYLVPAGK